MEVFALCGVQPQDVKTRAQAVRLAHTAGRMQLLADLIFARVELQGAVPVDDGRTVQVLQLQLLLLLPPDRCPNVAAACRQWQRASLAARRHAA